MGERGFDTARQSGFDRDAFIDAARHEPLGYVGLKGVVGQEIPERFFSWREAKLTAVSEEFGAGEAEILPNRAGGSEGFLQAVFRFELACRRFSRRAKIASVRRFAARLMR